MTCPSCGSVLIEKSARDHYKKYFKITQCKQCGGIWINESDFKKLPYKEAQKICRGFKKTAQVIDNIYYCPSCLISLSKKYEKKVGGSLVLRTCERCGKFFYTCKDLLDLKKKSESSLIKTPSQTR